MTALERFVSEVVAALLLCVAGWFWHVHAVSVAREAGDRAGYMRAVDAGKAQQAEDAATNLRKERELRDNLAAKDAAANTKEQEYATNLQRARDSVRTGAVGLRCPATVAGAIQPGAAPATGPAATGPALNEPGAAIVPALADDILRAAADAAGLVRKYDRLAERYDACRAMNNNESAGNSSP